MHTSLPSVERTVTSEVREIIGQAAQPLPPPQSVPQFIDVAEANRLSTHSAHSAAYDLGQADLWRTLLTLDQPLPQHSQHYDSNLMAFMELQPKCLHTGLSRAHCDCISCSTPFR